MCRGPNQLISMILKIWHVQRLKSLDFKDFQINRNALQQNSFELNIINNDDTLTTISWKTCCAGKHKTTKEIIQYVYDEEKQKSKDLSWRYEFNIAEEVLVYNIILIDGVYKYVKRKGIIISVNLKSISVLPYKYTIIKNEEVNRIIWNEHEFEKRVVIYNRYNIFKSN